MKNTAPAPHRIDVHHHPSPPSYIAARDQRNRASAWKQEQWSPQKSLDDMDEGGVATAVLSLPHPVSIWPADIEEGRRSALNAAGLDKITFAWYGEPDLHQAHHYRVQGPTFVIEYNNTQNNANHVHSMWRNLAGDFALPPK